MASSMPARQDQVPLAISGPTSVRLNRRSRCAVLRAPNVPMQDAAEKSWLEGASIRGITIRGLKLLRRTVENKVAERRPLAC
jgi:hypothetical protein